MLLRSGISLDDRRPPATHAQAATDHNTAPPTAPGTNGSAFTGWDGMQDSDARTLRSGPGPGGDQRLFDALQTLVDHRQHCRRSQKYTVADLLRKELSAKQVRVDDQELVWRGPGGMGGRVNNPELPRDEWQPRITPSLPTARTAAYRPRP